MVGEPSTELMKQMGDEEKARTAKQIKQLGESGLKKKADILQKATEENEVHVNSLFFYLFYTLSKRLSFLCSTSIMNCFRLNHRKIC